MPHFYVDPDNISNSNFQIKDEQAHYVSNVRRFKVGDGIMIFDGLGNSFHAKITSMSKDLICGTIISSSYKISKINIDLYCAIPKGERFEWLIEKSAEIGINTIFPLNTQRSVITNFSKHKMERFEKISISASSQCGRNDLMKINYPIDFNSACQNVSKFKNAVSIIPWESQEESKTISTVFKNIKTKKINIFIGPEGGFENAEIELAKSLNIKPVSLGENILRIETAAIVASVLALQSTNYGETF